MHRGDKWLIDGRLMGLAYRSGKGSMTGHWIGTYTENGKRCQKYLGKEDPREHYPRVVRPPKSRRVHHMKVPPGTWDGFLEIETITGEPPKQIQTRLVKQELERLHKKGT